MDGPKASGSVVGALVRLRVNVSGQERGDRSALTDGREIGRSPRKSQRRRSTRRGHDVLADDDDIHIDIDIDDHVKMVFGYATGVSMYACICGCVYGRREDLYVGGHCGASDILSTCEWSSGSSTASPRTGC